MNKRQWVEKAMALADEMAERYGCEQSVYEAGSGDVERLAEECRQEHTAARKALIEHLNTSPDGV